MTMRFRESRPLLVAAFACVLSASAWADKDRDMDWAKVNGTKNEYRKVYGKVQRENARIAELKELLEAGTRELAAAREAYAEQSRHVLNLSTNLHKESRRPAPPELAAARKRVEDAKAACDRVQEPVLRKVHAGTFYGVMKESKARLEGAIAKLRVSGSAKPDDLAALTKGLSETSYTMREREQQAIESSPACAAAAAAVAEAEKALAEAEARAKASDAAVKIETMHEEYQSARKELSARSRKVQDIQKKYQKPHSEYTALCHSNTRNEARLKSLRKKLSGWGVRFNSDGTIYSPKPKKRK